ncbi:uncharacterized protein METZ01_LOCUS463927 [marine metagenome]|uniref:Uncharacterized protein n=1 Tax=marine metagenome TaxID=408172 RepID=A0A383AU20_9ZZZZ
MNFLEEGIPIDTPPPQLLTQVIEQV